MRKRPIALLTRAARAGGGFGGAVAGSGADDLLLLNTLHASGGLLARLASWCARIENLSHVLVWSRTRGRVGEGCEVSLVQFPRLRAEFVPRIDDDGVCRMYSQEHAGLFVSDARSRPLARQLAGLPQSVVLEDRYKQQFVLVPNVELTRPADPARPMSTDLAPKRSKKWMAAVDARFYVYPLHASGAFLSPPSLASALYLVALRLLHREYVMVAAALPSCASDVAFAREEGWALQQVKASGDDLHPDAIACRLRVSLLCGEAGSGELAPSGKEDYDAYLARLPRVSAVCALTLEEEAALAAAFESFPRLKYLQAMAALQEREAAAAAMPASVPLRRAPSFVLQSETVESAHPYACGEDKYVTIQFPGAFANKWRACFSTGLALKLSYRFFLALSVNSFIGRR